MGGRQWCMAQSGGRGMGAISNWWQSALGGVFLAGGIKTCMRSYFWRKSLRIRVAWLSLSHCLQNHPRPIQERFILYVIAPPPCTEQWFYEWISEGRRVGATERLDIDGEVRRRDRQWRYKEWLIKNKQSTDKKHTETWKKRVKAMKGRRMERNRQSNSLRGSLVRIDTWPLLLLSSIPSLFSTLSRSRSLSPPSTWARVQRWYRHEARRWWGWGGGSFITLSLNL